MKNSKSRLSNRTIVVAFSFLQAGRRDFNLLLLVSLIFFRKFLLSL